MMESDLGAAVKIAVHEWMQDNTLVQQNIELDSPDALSAKLASKVERELTKAGFIMTASRQAVLEAPYFHLKRVFEATDLPETPESFTPVPSTPGSIAARAAALAVHGFLYMESVSYGTENEGALFVNLVPLPGEGVYADKSKSGMRGHTDAVSFPFNGDLDVNDSRVAPSPDLVTLVGLRNPNSVATKAIVLDAVLGHLSSADISELKKHQYSIVAQATFKQEMKNQLGKVHTVINEPILKDVRPTPHVRYSHSSVMPTEDEGAAKEATDNFEAACLKVAISIVIEPGDVLVLSNRLCLHGRDIVGDSVGDESRWLLRTYGLDTSDLDPSRRHLGKQPKHVLYP